MKGITAILCILFPVACLARTINFTGRVMDKKTREAIEFANVRVEGSGIGAITDEKGEYTLQSVPEGNATLVISCLGYATQRIPITVTEGMKPIVSYLPEMNLSLSEVTVTARRKTSDATTAYTIDRTALDHLQNISVADAMSLLPGEHTNAAYKLTSGNHTITLRGGTSSEIGNPGFGTVVEMDGVRLSNNATVTSSQATDTRNIGNNNIERIEVITGVPSVEYGDLTNGVVKINTFKGKTPFYIEAGVRPNTQAYSFSKGFDLQQKRGMLNMSYERARSISDLASPYTTYVRNALTLRYSNIFLTARQKQLELDVNLGGNIGGYNSKSDPDAFKESFQRTRDNELRSSMTLTYRANSPWLSLLNAGIALSYSDNLYTLKESKSAAAALPAIHTMSDGYFVASKYEEDPRSSILLLPTGYWYSTQYESNKPVNYNAYLKTRWSHRFRRLNSNLLVGGELKGDGNLGEGVYYDNMRTTPTWRPYRYSDLPFTNNLSLYAEEEVRIVFPHSSLQLKGGVRQDMTFVKESAYGTVGSLSPRFNASYTFAESTDLLVRGIKIRAGWGKAVKLPSFYMLYPRTTYSDRLAFAPGTLADGTSYYAYYTHPSQLLYNKNLKWQYNVMRELGIDARLKGVRLSLAFYYNTMRHSYDKINTYTPMDYAYTDQSALEKISIPSPNRQYTIDRQTGIVTVTDKTGRYPTQQLEHKVMKDFQASSMSMNGSSSKRIGFEWVLDFDPIRLLNTSVRIDGKYYYYRGVNELITQSASALRTAEGQPLPYVGYYVGGAVASNGMQTKQLNTNVTFVTHIPKIT